MTASRGGFNQGYSKEVMLARVKYQNQVITPKANIHRVAVRRRIDELQEQRALDKAFEL